MSVPTVEFQAEPRRRYLVNGQPVPSVTQILGVLDKPALVWWGMRVGVEGACRLQDAGELPADPDKAVKALTAKKLTVNHVKTRAATRGTSLHDALEAYMRDGTVPMPAGFPEADRGYVRALAKAMLDLNPVPLAMEVVVGSAAHGFGGRYDLLCELGGNQVRLDLKTGKRVYETAHLQLAAYELAALEMGETRSDYQAILRLGEDGAFEFTVGRADPAEFLAVKAAYDAVTRVKREVREAAKKAKAAA